MNIIFSDNNVKIVNCVSGIVKTDMLYFYFYFDNVQCYKTVN